MMMTMMTIAGIGKIEDPVVASWLLSRAAPWGIFQCGIRRVRGDPVAYGSRGSGVRRKQFGKNGDR